MSLKLRTHTNFRQCNTINFTLSTVINLMMPLLGISRCRVVIRLRLVVTVYTEYVRAGCDALEGNSQYGGGLAC
jgi:hypothetical protein